MTARDERLARLLGGPELAALRARLRTRFERGRVGDVLTLVRLTPLEHQTLTGLLGRRPREASSLRVSFSELDEALARAELAPSLRHALELLDGPIPDLTRARAERNSAWARTFALVRDARLVLLVSQASTRGLIKRLAGGDAAVAQALLRSAELVLSRLPAQGVPRSQLAADLLGDAHALDAGRPLATLVLLAMHEEEDERPRETWARVGVLVNELAKPALLLNLPAEPEGSTGLLVHATRDTGQPLALTLRALLRTPARWLVRDRDVYICENANLLAIASDQLGSACAPMVCTDGMPSASQRTLLRQLRDAGARLCYHGDFDWPGLRIANYVMRTFGAMPWRFCAADYIPRPGRALKGKPVIADWDPALTAAMLAGGYAIDEEALAATLLDDLRLSAERSPLRSG